MIKNHNSHIAPLLCAVLLLGTAVPSARADCPPGYRSQADAASAAQTAVPAGSPTFSGAYYPVSVEEYSEAGEARIRKIYQLSLSDDPSLIPTGSFTRDGRTYHLLDITQKDEIGVDTKEHTETITQDSDTGEIAEILKVLPAQKKVTTKDGYSGTLLLDHTSIDVSVKGYQTSSRNLSATRTYPSLSDADLSLIPKSISSGGTQLTLGDVQWSNDGTYYTAAATYTGTVSSRYATGYTVKANYTGQVAKTSCEVATYTAVFGSEPLSIPPASSTAETGRPEDSKTGEASEAAEAAEAENEPEAENKPETADTRSGRHRKDNLPLEPDNVKDSAKTQDTSETEMREDRAVFGICVASCVIGIVGVLCLLVQLLPKLRGLCGRKKEKKEDRSDHDIQPQQ